MNKLMKKALCLLLAVMMLLTPMAVSAEGELGESDNPYEVKANDSWPLKVSLAPGETAWVKADIGSSTLSVGYATTADYQISYNGRTFYPETTSGDNTLHFGISDNTIPFTVTNTGSESVLVCMTVAAGEYIDPTGTADYPEVVPFEPDPRTGLISAMLERELSAGNNGYYFSITAPDDGAISVFVYTYDAEYNSLGWTYSVSNITAGRYGAIHYSTDEEPVSTEMFEVSKGDQLLVAAATYDPEKPFTNPEGILFVMFGFSEIGSMDLPEKITETGNFSTTLESGNQGYFYSWTAETEGTVTVTMNDDAGWQYSIIVTHTDETYTYGDTHWYNDDPVVSSESYEVAPGDVLEILIATLDPNLSWAGPAGTVNWTLSFVEASGILYGDIDADGDISTKDVLMLRKNLASMIELDEAAIAAADCDGDGELSTKDVLCIRKYLAGIVTELPLINN